MDVSLFRKRFAEFLGDEQFVKFVAQLRRSKGRLRYWQEEVLSRFVAAFPEYRDSLHSPAHFLNICELHGGELHLDSIEVIEGCVDYSAWYIREMREKFPNAASGPLFTEGAPFVSRFADVWFCPECRKAQSASRVKHSRHPFHGEMRMTRQTTLDAYGAEWGYAEFGGEKWAALRMEIEAVLHEGGQLWEWESAGFQSFAGTCGLAVIREDHLVKHWNLAKS